MQNISNATLNTKYYKHHGVCTVIAPSNSNDYAFNFRQQKTHGRLTMDL